MKKKNLRQKIESYTYNHYWMRYVIDYGSAFFISVISAAIFAFGFNTFIAPSAVATSSGTFTFPRIISGGASGLAQTLSHLLEVFGLYMPSGFPTFYSIFYIAVNIPLVILAFKGIGIRFGSFTLVNVAFVFLFTNLFKGEFFNNVALFFASNGGIISRALFAGICTGLSSALAYKFETSAGGIDIISYYLSLRKGTTAGKYGIIVNACIVVSYSIITGISHEPYTTTLMGNIEVTLSSWQYAFVMVLFSIIYLFTVMLLIDFINVRNKKVQIQIISNVEKMPSLLLANIPHGATIVQAKGAFSGDSRQIIYMVVSSLELKNVIRIIREIDPNSFVNVTALQQVYGRFFQKPIK